MTEPIVNLALVAHVDAGKTTLAERLMYLCGSIRAIGRVDEGTAHTDTLPVERARGISVRCAAAQIAHGGVRIHLIDAPGHADFAAEAERSLSAADAALLIVSAREGVEPQTRALWKAIERAGIPTIAFVNKTDREGASVPRTIGEIRERLTDRILLLPTAGESSDALIERLCEGDDALTERYLSGEPIGRAELDAAIREGIAELRIVPALAGSALTGEGVSELADFLASFAPRAGDRSDGALSGTAFRVEHDPAHGKIAYIRLFGGTIRNRDGVYNASKGIHEKATQIRAVVGARLEDRGILRAGEIGAVIGFSGVEAGDALGEATVGRDVRLAAPLLRARVEPAAGERFDRLADALQKLSAEDPSLRPAFGHLEAHAHLTGAIRGEILLSDLKERFGIAARLNDPRILYKETPARPCEGFEAYTMPKPCWAVVKFYIEPLPTGSGVVYGEALGNESIHYRYRGQIRQTIPEALRQGPLGWEVTDVRITLIGGEDHPIHTHPLDFALATPLAVMDGLVRGGTTLLEPILSAEISAPSEFAGKILGDMVRMRAEFEPPAMRGDRFELTARIPAATSLDYPIRLAAATSGKASLAMEFAGYRPCPLEFGATHPRIGADPRDRARYILTKRGAMTE